MNTDVILKAQDLFFSYDDGASYALSGLSVDIRRGQKSEARSLEDND